MTRKPLRFIRRGAVQTLHDVAPDRTLLELLREDLGCSGTKEGCGEGDCGACTVVLAAIEGDALRFRAVNSCIRLAHAIDGMALWTVQDLAAGDGRLHPAQAALLQHHASQCGFCTPGFVMSLFALYQNHVVPGEPVTRERALHALSGNLCRCTGYRPILDAAQAMAALPGESVDTTALQAQLRALQTGDAGVGAAPATDAQSGRTEGAGGAGGSAAPAYLAPTDLAALLRARAAHPQAQLVAGCTDVGLWVTKQHRRFKQVLDVTRAAELQRIERYPQHLAIGAAVPLEDAFAALVQDRPQLRAFAHRFAGLPVRNAGTLGGNVANGSPIGDSMPLLIALGAHVVLMRTGAQRHLPLEALYTGYRRNVMAADELLAWVVVPLPVPGELLRVYKISKRFEDDISAVCLAINLQFDDGLIARASIGVGGVAATPVRARQTEASLLGRRWNSELAEQAAQTLGAEFQPISDLRASAKYRKTLLGNLVRRFWLESQGASSLNLESFALEGARP